MVQNKVLAAIMVIALLAIIAVGLTFTGYKSSLSSTNKSLQSSTLATTTSSTTVVSSLPTSPITTSSSSNTSGLTTLEAIINGAYPTATDKNGTGGMTVTVTGLQVLYVSSESDGDWHVAVTDGEVPVFITEIRPSYQASEGKPAAGTVIDETGVPYCDTVHQTEAWHGNTCWELHPVLSWHLSSITATNTTSTTASQVTDFGIDVTISYAQNPISRGSMQTISILATDADGPIKNTSADVQVLYASGSTTYGFNCVTTTAGACSISWQIGGNSTPGTFMVTVTVEGQVFHSSFEVTTA